MGKHFWLIQRGSFRDLKSATKFLGGSPTHLINPDYMGAAEFEWGAIPRAYRRIMGHLVSWMKRGSSIIPVPVLARFLEIVLQSGTRQEKKLIG